MLDLTSTCSIKIKDRSIKVYQCFQWNCANSNPVDLSSHYSNIAVTIMLWIIVIWVNWPKKIFSLLHMKFILTLTWSEQLTKLWQVVCVCVGGGGGGGGVGRSNKIGWFTRPMFKVNWWRLYSKPLLQLQGFITFDKINFCVFLH